MELNTAAQSRCKHCNNLDPRDHNESARGTKGQMLTLMIPVSNLGPGCRYCSLLKEAASYFVPGLADLKGDPYVVIVLEESCAASVQVSYHDSLSTFVTPASFHVYLPAIVS
jgi:hypothetical protein